MIWTIFHKVLVLWARILLCSLLIFQKKLRNCNFIVKYRTVDLHCTNSNDLDHFSQCPSILYCGPEFFCAPYWYSKNLRYCDCIVKDSIVDLDNFSNDLDHFQNFLLFCVAAQKSFELPTDIPKKLRNCKCIVNVSIVDLDCAISNDPDDFSQCSQILYCGPEFFCATYWYSKIAIACVHFQIHISTIFVFYCILIFILRFFLLNSHRRKVLTPNNWKRVGMIFKLKY